MTILGYLLKNIENRPNELALRSDNFTLTFQELGNCIVNFMDSQDFSQDEKIVVLNLKNQIKWVIAFYGCLFRSQWLLVVSQEYNLTQLKKHNLVLHYLLEFTIDKAIYPNRMSLKEPSKTTGIYQITSGTTGLPALCRRTVFNITMEGIRYKDCFKLTEKDKIINIPPLYHSFSFGAALVTSIICGLSLTLVNAISPKKIHQLVKEHEITHMILSPNIVKLFLLTEQEFSQEYKTIKTVLVGAGSISKEVSDQFFWKFGVLLSGNYGSTETGALFSRKFDEPLLSIGKAMLGIHYLIKDEDGNRIPKGRMGELWVNYEGLQNSTKEIDILMDAEGYYPMGDLAKEDENGFLFIVGRKKLMINMGGKKIYPWEVENVIKEYPNVVNCIILEYKKKNKEKRIKAIVEGTSLSENEIREYCLSKLPLYMVPTMIEICKQIPRNEMGKIKYFDLEETYEYKRDDS